MTTGPDAHPPVPAYPELRGTVIGAVGAFTLACSPLLGVVVVVLEVLWVRSLAQRPGHAEFCRTLVRAALVSSVVVAVLYVAAIAFAFGSGGPDP